MNNGWKPIKETKLIDPYIFNKSINLTCLGEVLYDTETIVSSEYNTRINENVVKFVGDVNLSGDDIMRRKLKVWGLYMRSKHDNVGGRNKEKGTVYNKFDKLGF